MRSSRVQHGVVGLGEASSRLSARAETKGRPAKRLSAVPFTRAHILGPISKASSLPRPVAPHARRFEYVYENRTYDARRRSIHRSDAALEIAERRAIDRMRAACGRSLLHRARLERRSDLRNRGVQHARAGDRPRRRSQTRSRCEPLEVIQGLARFESDASI